MDDQPNIMLTRIQAKSVSVSDRTSTIVEKLPLEEDILYIIA